MNDRMSPDEVIELVAEFEGKGAEFYRRLEALASDEGIASMCALFAGQEREHERRFRELAPAHRPGRGAQGSLADVREMLRASLRELGRIFDVPLTGLRGPETLSECLAIAEKTETTSILLYTKMLETYAAPFADVLNDVLRQEVEHLRMLRKVRSTLQAPAVT